MTVPEKGGRPTKEQKFMRDMEELLSKSYVKTMEIALGLLEDGTRQSIREGRQMMRTAIELRDRMMKTTDAIDSDEDKKDSNTDDDISSGSIFDRKKREDIDRHYIDEFDEDEGTVEDRQESIFKRKPKDDKKTERRYRKLAI